MRSLLAYRATVAASNLHAKMLKEECKRMHVFDCLRKFDLPNKDLTVTRATLVIIPNL